MNSFLKELVDVFLASAALTVTLVLIARFRFRRGKSLEEP